MPVSIRSLVLISLLLPGWAARADSANVRTGLQAQYRRMDAAFSHGRRLNFAFTPGARVVDPFGKEEPAKSDLENLRRARFKESRVRARTAVQQVAMGAGSAVANVRTVWTITQSSKRDGSHRGTVEWTFRDTWVRWAGEWRIRRREYRGTRMVVDGGELIHTGIPRSLGKAERAAIVDEIAARAVPLAGTDPSAPSDDLEELDRVIGSARIVAIGEGSHGAAEFAQMQQRLVRYLVAKRGFTVVALEACWTNPEPLESALVDPKADVGAAVAEMWRGWANQDDRDLARWIHNYNAERGARTPVTLTSLDLLDPWFATRRLEQYASKLPAAESARYRRLLKRIEADAGGGDWKQRAARSRSRVEAIVTWLDGHRAARASAAREAGEAAFRRARHAARLLWQWYDTRVGPFWPQRDRAMAENVKWLADEAHRGQKLILIAHNGHVTRSTTAVLAPMGSHLANRFGRQMVVIGLTSYEGAIRVFHEEDEKSSGPHDLAVIPVPPAREESIEALFHATGRPVFALDLRSVPGQSALGKWLSEPVYHRSIGNAFSPSDDRQHYPAVVLPRAFDAMIYVEKTTPRSAPLGK